VREHES